MTFVDDTLRAVSVEKVDGKEQGLGEELESMVSLEEEVEEVGTHKPLNFSLDLDGIDVRHRLGLSEVSNAIVR